MSDIPSQKRKQPEPGLKRKKHGLRAHAPGFLFKVYEMLSDPSNAKVVSWGEDGSTLVIKKQTEFADKILPKYFKHSNFTSFVRQLNMYDFHKVKQDAHSTCFTHPQFRRGAKHLLPSIKRKIAKKESSSEGSDSGLGELQDIIGTLQERLARLENRDKDREWLKTECQKLQQRNQNLEMLCMYLSTLYSQHGGTGNGSRSIYISSGEGQKHREQQRVFKSYYNGLQKLWADSVSQYAAHNGNNGSPKRLSEISSMRRSSFAQSQSPKLVPCRRVMYETNLMDSPIYTFKPAEVIDSSPCPPSAPDMLRSPGLSPQLSPLRLDRVLTPKDPLQQSPMLPSMVRASSQGSDHLEGSKGGPPVEEKVEYGSQAIYNDLD